MDEFVEIRFDLRKCVRIARVELAKIFKSRQEDIDSVPILCERAAGIEQRLKKLVIRCKLYFKMRVEFPSPEKNRRPQRIGCKSGGNGEAEPSRLLSRKADVSRHVQERPRSLSYSDVADSIVITGFHQAE
jgi:hypothetical protein